MSVKPKRLALTLADLGGVLVQQVGSEGQLLSNSKRLAAEELWKDQQVPVIIYAVRRPG